MGFNIGIEWRYNICCFYPHVKPNVSSYIYMYVYIYIYIRIYIYSFIYLVAAISPLVDLTLATQSHQAIEHGLQ